jgi:hypothetical protein
VIAALLISGLCSWFTPYQRMYSGMRVCAMRPRWLIGKRIQIEGNRRRSNCVVIGYGPAAWTGRILDVSPATRDDLHMREVGVVFVKVYLVH